MSKEKKYKLLIIDDEPDYRETLSQLFESEGYITKTASSGQEGLNMSEKEYFPVIITDVMMDSMNGIEFLHEIKSQYHDEVEVIMVTGYGSIETAVETVKIGAFGYFIKGKNPEELIEEVNNAIKNIELKNKKNISEAFVISSKNPQMQKIQGLIDTIANSNANVLITGESGTGKEIIAKQIHLKSNRSNFPFIPINCQSLPSSLIESELFGHEKGSFTGANDKRIGKLEQCSGGTIFLDEIGEMPTSIQVKLLRVLETRTIERIGSNVPIEVDFRLVSATNRDITKAVFEHLFREDLLYRINTFEIKLPPLRERKEDIPQFVNFFIEKYSRETGKAITKIDENTKSYLFSYDYPGNIRELKNIIEKLVILATSDGIIKMPGISKSSFVYQIESLEVDNTVNYKDAKRIFEKAYIEKALKNANGNISLAAEKIELSRRQLFNKIKELGIK